MSVKKAFARVRGVDLLQNKSLAENNAKTAPKTKDIFGIVYLDETSVFVRICRDTRTKNNVCVCVRGITKQKNRYLVFKRR